MTSPRRAPEVVVETAGTPLGAEERRALTGVRVSQRLSLPGSCELAFADPPGPLDGPAARLAPGADLRVGLAGHPGVLFAGQVTVAEHGYDPERGRSLLVRAYDRLHRLRKRQQARAYTQVTMRDVAAELAAPAGLRVRSDHDGPFWEHLVQHRQSDLDLLLELAERSGLYLAVRDATLHLLTLDGIGEAVGLELGGTLLEARIEVSGEPACRAVTAIGWDPSLARPYQARVSGARVGRAVGARVEPGAVGGSGQRDLVGELARDAAHAEALAQAELDQRVAAEVTLNGVAEGDPRLQPGTPVLVGGVASALAGRYVLTAVTHRVDEDRGFVSEVSTEPPPPRPRRYGAVAAPGTVTRIDDPQRLGRVRARLDSYGDVETDWLCVASAGAGAGKGLMTVPDVGDQVLLLLAEGDPAKGVVVAGLYGSTAPEDAGIDDGAVRRFTFLTRGGQRIRLDDQKRSLRLEDAGGSFVELGPERVVVHSETDLCIQAPGRPVVVRGASIDFESA